MEGVCSDFTVWQARFSDDSVVFSTQVIDVPSSAKVIDEALVANSRLKRFLSRSKVQFARPIR